MKTTSPWCLVKFLGAAAALLLLIHGLLNGFAAWTLIDVPRSPPAAPRPGTHRSTLSPSTYSYVLNQPDRCHNRRPLLLALVPVVPADRTSRDAIRRTWGAADEDQLTVVLFFVGLSADEGARDAVAAESRRHGDVVQMDFLDTYRNLTIKTLMMMRWVATYCPGASYAMKVDADIFVNVYYLKELLLRGAYPAEGFITGSVIRDGRPRRDRGSKWYVSEDAYPEPYFPPYVSGAAYLFSADVARKVCAASRHVPAVPLEDVYVGLCLRAAGVAPVYAQGALALRNLFEVRRLGYDRCAYAARIIVNGFTPEELVTIWHDFSRNYLSC